MQVRKPRRGDLLDVRLEALGAKGEAVGTSDVYTVRMRDGVPGDHVRGEVLRRRRDDVEARLVEVLEAGPYRVAPRCKHFGPTGGCGGCSRQDLSYARQLELLGSLFERWIEPVREPSTRVDAVLGMEDPWNYRNKMDFTFGNHRWVRPDEPEDASRDFALGMHARGRFDKVLDVEGCDIAFAEATPIVTTARELARERGLDAWDVRAHTGLLRHLVLRKGVRTNEILAYLVTNVSEEGADGWDERIDDYAAALVARHPEITTLVHGVTARLATVAQAEEVRVLHGSGVIEEELCGLRFEISPESFFQTNTVQAERLAWIVREAAALRPEQVVYDLYCGGGALSLVVAAAAAETQQIGAPRQLYGFELVESAVRDARANAARNGIENARFVAGDLATTLGAASREALDIPPPDLCLVDPPRAGLHKDVVEALLELAPPRLVYVSCNPRSAVRDLELLTESTFRLERAQPVDLFPHTPHLECVFTLVRR